MNAGATGRGREGVAAEDLLGHPASPTPKAAVALSPQQPYTVRLQCFSSVGSGGDVAEGTEEEVEREEGEEEEDDRRTCE